LSKIKATSQAPKKTLKLSTLVSSLLQIHPSPIFNCGIRVESRAEARLKYISQLGAQSVVAIGNGRNDRMMLKAVGLGIAVVQVKGAGVRGRCVAEDIGLGSSEESQTPRRHLAVITSPDLQKNGHIHIPGIIRCRQASLPAPWSTQAAF
jgi:hypothetical protein